MKENENVIVVRCLLSWENLAANQMHGDLSVVFKAAASVTNYMKFRPLCTRLFLALCEVNGAEHSGLLLHSNVRWFGGYHEERCCREWLSYAMKLANFRQSRVIQSPMVLASSGLLSSYYSLTFSAMQTSWISPRRETEKLFWAWQKKFYHLHQWLNCEYIEWKMGSYSHFRLWTCSFKRKMLIWLTSQNLYSIPSTICFWAGQSIFLLTTTLKHTRKFEIILSC